MKYLYILVGFVGLIYSLEVISVLGSLLNYGLYVFTTPRLLISALFIPSVLSLGIIYTYYGIRYQKINYLSNISMVFSFIIIFSSFALLPYTCTHVGGYCTPTKEFIDSIYDSVIQLGIIISAILLVTSLFIRKKI